MENENIKAEKEKTFYWRFLIVILFSFAITYSLYWISQVQQPLSTMLNKLDTIKGVGKTTENIIREILNTNSSTFYEHLLKG